MLLSYSDHASFEQRSCSSFELSSALHLKPPGPVEASEAHMIREIGVLHTSTQRWQAEECGRGHQKNRESVRILGPRAQHTKSWPSEHALFT
mmetsp:Transcript_23244/g.62343  ORF Transcript_23244/g.62343 Transcript_23244/m.62343 type:complete len:92 (-) Transcript_23244:759-1034(-)